jgi:hypothetical protein
MIHRLALCLLLAGCAGARQDAVRPARLAVSAAADALARAQQIELLRIRLAVMNRAMACEQPTKECGARAVALGFDDEQENIRRLLTLEETQSALASAITAFDGCRESGGNVEACEARAFALIQSLAPRLLELTDALRKAVR